MAEKKQKLKNSFYGDVLLDSVNMSYRDEHSIFYQIHEKQIFSDLIIDFRFKEMMEERAYLRKLQVLWNKKKS